MSHPLHGNHEAMLAALDGLMGAADRERAWVTAKHHSATA